MRPEDIDDKIYNILDSKNKKIFEVDSFHRGINIFIYEDEHWEYLFRKDLKKYIKEIREKITINCIFIVIKRISINTRKMKKLFDFYYDNQDIELTIEIFAVDIYNKRLTYKMFPPKIKGSLLIDSIELKEFDLSGIEEIDELTLQWVYTPGKIFSYQQLPQNIKEELTIIFLKALDIDLRGVKCKDVRLSNFIIKENILNKLPENISEDLNIDLLCRPYEDEDDTKRVDVDFTNIKKVSKLIIESSTLSGIFTEKILSEKIFNIEFKFSGFSIFDLSKCPYIRFLTFRNFGFPDSFLDYKILPPALFILEVDDCRLDKIDLSGIKSIHTLKLKRINFYNTYSKNKKLISLDKFPEQIKEKLIIEEVELERLDLSGIKEVKDIELIFVKVNNEEIPYELPKEILPQKITGKIKVINDEDDFLDDEYLKSIKNEPLFITIEVKGLKKKED